MRVSMSAMGSVMLICSPSSFSPARLDDAGDLAAHRVFAQLVAAETELAEYAARAARQCAAVAQTCRVRVARQLLKLEPRGKAVLVGDPRIFDDRDQRLALLRVFRDELFALVLTIDECELGHANP